MDNCLDRVKYIRPYLYNSVYSRPENMNYIVESIKSLNISFNPVITYNPFAILIPLKKTFCKGKSLEELNAIVASSFNQIMTGLLTANHAAIDQYINGSFEGEPVDSHAIYNIAVTNPQLLYFQSIVDSMGKTVRITL